MFGLGTALAYAPPLAVAMKWYPKSKVGYYAQSRLILTYTKLSNLSLEVVLLRKASFS